eukprot:m.276393 g.276393  ORF g.276393 m.276393 type:complete len:745 (+) comp17697_c1_seq12:4986-7220(+)
MSDLEADFKRFCYTTDQSGNEVIDLCKVTLLAISLHSSRRSNENNCRLIRKPKQSATLSARERVLLAIDRAIDKLPHHGVRFTLPSGASFDFKFEAYLQRGTKMVVDYFKVHLSTAFRAQIKEWSGWLIKQHQTCRADAEAAGAMLSAVMARDVMKFYIAPELTGEANKRALLDALKHMPPRLSGGIIPRNMARCIPSPKPGLNEVDALLQRGLATFGLKFRAHNYTATQCEDVDDCSFLADLKHVVMAPLPTDIPPFQVQTSSKAKRRTPRYSASRPKTRAKAAKMSKPVTKKEASEGLSDLLLHSLDHGQAERRSAAPTNPGHDYLTVQAMTTLELPFGASALGDPLPMETDWLEMEPTPLSNSLSGQLTGTSVANSSALDPSRFKPSLFPQPPHTSFARLESSPQVTPSLLPMSSPASESSCEGNGPTTDLMSHVDGGMSERDVQIPSEPLLGQDGEACTQGGTVQVASWQLADALHTAMLANDASGFKRLLTMSPQAATSLFVTQDHGKLPLVHLLIAHGKADLVNVLLDSKLPFSKPAANGKRSDEAAIHFQQPEELAALFVSDEPRTAPISPVLAVSTSANYESTQPGRLLPSTQLEPTRSVVLLASNAHELELLGQWLYPTPIELSTTAINLASEEVYGMVNQAALQKASCLLWLHDGKSEEQFQRLISEARVDPSTLICKTAAISTSNPAELSDRLYTVGLPRPSQVLQRDGSPDFSLQLKSLLLKTVYPLRPPLP